MTQADRDGPDGEHFTLIDFQSQLAQIYQLKSLQKVMDLIPGMSGLMDTISDLDFEEYLKRLNGIIDSMTAAEREAPKKVIDRSRRCRIADGAGVEPRDVQELVSQFNAMAKLKTQKPIRPWKRLADSDWTLP